jgi:glutathione S-transferase
MKRHLVRLLHALDDQQMQILYWLDWIAQDIEPVRPDRKAPRRNPRRVPQAIGNHTRCP